jgi:hypothetical protein
LQAFYVAGRVEFQTQGDGRNHNILKVLLGLEKCGERANLPTWAKFKE